jgi:hypothetical protein
MQFQKKLKTEPHFPLLHHLPTDWPQRHNWLAQRPWSHLTQLHKQPTTQLCSSKRKANQQSAPLTTSASTPEKAKKSKAAESVASSPSLPPASTPEGVKHSKPKPVESASTVVPPPPLPAETAKLTSPVAVAGSKKVTADAAKSSVVGIAFVSEGVSVTAADVNAISASTVVNPVSEAVQEKSSGEEDESDDGSSSNGSGSSGEEEERWVWVKK